MKTVSSGGVPKLETNCSHSLVHEGLIERPPLDEDQKSRVNHLASAGLAPYQICKQFRSEGNKTISCHQVHHEWHNSMKAMYFHHDDPFISMTRLVHASDNLSLIFESSSRLLLGSPQTWAECCVRNMNVLKCLLIAHIRLTVRTWSFSQFL